MQFRRCCHKGYRKARLQEYRVGEIMANVLSDLDRAPLPSNGDIRWRNTAMWERYEMVQTGLMSNQSPHGVWEITEEGRSYLNEHRN